jgi:glycine cleavage system H protein
VEGIGAVDIFATKGIEYLIVIGFLGALVCYWKFLGPSETEVTPGRVTRAVQSWFSAPLDYLFHPGHTWAVRENEGVYKVGMDDFAQRLVGAPSSVDLPSPGETVRQGDLGWTVRVGANAVRMLSPVDGIVESVNSQVADDPGVVNRDPYESGWLMKVRVPDDARPARNLITGGLVRDELNRTAEKLREMMTPELGLMLPDGGEPVLGFGRALSDDRWPEVAERLLLSSSLPKGEK